MGSRLEKNSTAIRRDIESHTFDDEEGEEYESSKFGGFPEYFRRKKIKLQNLDVQLRSEHGDKPKIFRGIVAHVNGYTQPSLNDLHTLIVAHGGGFIQYLDGKTQVTHIIASNLTPKKAEDFKRYRIVKPAWIVDSVAGRKLLPWEDYRVVDEGTKQKILRFDESGVTSQVNKKRTGYREQSDTSWYTRQLAEDPQRSENVTTDDFFDEFNLSKSSSHSSESQGRKADRPTPNFPQIAFSEPSRKHFAEEDHQDVSDARLPATRKTTTAKTPSNGLSMEAEDAITAPFETDEMENGLDGYSKRAQTGKSDTTASKTEQATEMSGNPPFLRNEQQDALKRKSDEESPQPEKRIKMTAEDHNRVLLSDPHIRKSSVLNPDFLEQYYRESRLHHLSTWKADLKSQLQALTSEKSASQRQRQKRASNARRYILHVDFDSFFVAVSLKSHPHIGDKPAVVAHGAGSGSEIASCNYAARKYGIKNGMWMKRAQEMCDEIEVLPYDFPAYEAASRLFYDAILDTSGIVQSVSIDEALVDISSQCHAAGGTDGTGIREGSIWREQAKADEIAQSIRDRVKAESGCAVSVGIGGNILLAKVALRKAKPAGQHQIKPEDALGFIGDLEVQSLPGVAHSIGGKLEEIGIKFVKDIREITKERLVSILGPKTGEKISNYSRGIDRTEVGDQVVRKSVSAEVNWGVRFETQEQVEEFMVSLSGELSRRLMKEGVKGRNLTMKVMRRAKDAPLDPPKHLGHGKCDIYNKSIVLSILTNDKDVISKETVSILRGFGFSPGELRGLGIQMTKLEPIKTSPANNELGSQRRLRFNAVQAPSKIPKEQLPNEKSVPQEGNPADEDDQRAFHLKDSARRGSQFKVEEQKDGSLNNPEAQDNIQDDPQTPRHLRIIAKSAHSQLPVDSPSRKPLNTLGTQFILPTQVDPQVLAELPLDIRSKLGHANQQKQRSALPFVAENGLDSSEIPKAFTALPNESQIDPEILQALPEDVRREIISQYQKSPTRPHPQRGQAILPQSPRKDRTVKTATTHRGATRGRPRGGSLLARLKGAASRNNPTLTQANFISANHTDSDSDKNAAEIAPEFLQALPDDIRAEVIENHKRERLKRNAGLEVFKRRRDQLSRQGNSGTEKPFNDRVIQLKRRPPPPTFTQQKLSQPEDLRAAVSSWVDEFYVDGPYEEDVQALCNYLKSVVVDERNMRKAVDLVRWVAHTIRGGPSSLSTSKQSLDWAEALEIIEGAVNDAVRSRGLGEVDFE